MDDLMTEIKQRYQGRFPDGNDLAAAFRADVGYLLSRMESAERALRYISDHHWVAGATPVKWINEFVDVANKALEQQEVSDV